MATQAATPDAANVYIASNKLSDLQTAVNNNTAVNAQLSFTGQTLTVASKTPNTTPVTLAGSTIQDSFTTVASNATLGSYASASDAVSGTVHLSVGGSTKTPLTLAANSTVSSMVDQINAANLGVTASLSTADPTTGFVSVNLKSNIFGSAGNIGDAGTAVTDNKATATLQYVKADAYNVGLSNSSVYDSSTGQNGGNLSSFVTNGGGSNGVATISYSDGAGVSLAATDLSSQADAQLSLTALNKAITAVAAQDGYIGAQINTLNAVSSVLSTQQQNVTAAQNAVQATDYAQAASNMSKYQILSQTGISALAQANSMQQEVTKLLQ
jgi:flagellin